MATLPAPTATKWIRCPDCDGEGGGFVDCTDSRFEHTTRGVECERCGGDGEIEVFAEACEGCGLTDVDCPCRPAELTHPERFA